MYRPRYNITPGDPLEVEIVQQDGAHVLIRGRIDSVPETVTGHQATKVRLVVTSIKPICPPTRPVDMPPLRLVPSTDH